MPQRHHHFHQVRSPQHIQFDQDPKGRRMEDSFHNTCWTLRVLGDAIRPVQHSSCFPKVHAQDPHGLLTHIFSSSTLMIFYFPDLRQNWQHVMRILQGICDSQMFFKAEKCSFHQTSVKFLGYAIGPNGVRMDEEKVTAISTWPAPTTIKELQHFLVFANFYRRFIGIIALLLVH